MALVRSRALTEETRKTRTYLMTVSVLMALVLILGVDVSELSVLGVKVSFGRAQILVALMVANIYLTILYTTQSLRDQTDQARLYDIDSHDAHVGKPIFDRLEQAVEDIESSKRLSGDGRQAVIASFMALAQGLAMSPTDLDEADESHVSRPKTDAIAAHLFEMLNNDLRPAEPELAARLITHMTRMQRRSNVYTAARIESFLRAESFSSLTHLVPTLASTVLTGFVAYGFFDPDAIAWFRAQVDAMGEVFKLETPPAE